MVDQRCYCDRSNCKVGILGKTETVLLAYISSALISLPAYSNAASATVKNVGSLPFVPYDISITSVIILAVWGISGYASAKEKHEKVMDCIIHACGLPGVLLAVFTAVSS